MYHSFKRSMEFVLIGFERRASKERVMEDMEGENGICLIFIPGFDRV